VLSVIDTSPESIIRNVILGPGRVPSRPGPEEIAAYNIYLIFKDLPCQLRGGARIQMSPLVQIETRFGHSR
jgi:hypothetical protein